MVAILAACNLSTTTLASDLSGTSSADGTPNASFLSIFRLPTSRLVPDAAYTNAPSLSIPLTGRQCPHVLGLLIERCDAGIPEMSVRQFINFGKGCLENRQSGDNCEIYLCSMFHADRSLKYLVLAVDKILRCSSYARATIGAQMLRARPLIDFVTDTNPLSGIDGLEGWQEAIARIIAIRDHSWNFDLPGIAVQLIQEHPDLLKALPCIGSGLFAVTWFLKWWFVKWWTWGSGDDGRIDDVEEAQEADNEEELPTDTTPSIFPENTVITLIHKRKLANNPVQYRFHIENLPHDADN